MTTSGRHLDFSRWGFSWGCLEQQEKAQLIIDNAVNRAFELGYGVKVETIMHHGKQGVRLIAVKLPDEKK